jgi:hypothetical protein
MRTKKKTFTLTAIIDGHIIRGQVRFSPPPEVGIMTEIARFEAERLLAHVVRDEIARGRLLTIATECRLMCPPLTPASNGAKDMTAGTD